MIRIYKCVHVFLIILKWKCVLYNSDSLKHEHKNVILKILSKYLSCLKCWIQTKCMYLGCIIKDKVMHDITRVNVRKEICLGKIYYIYHVLNDMLITYSTSQKNLHQGINCNK